MSKIIQINNHPQMGKWTKFFEVPSESNPTSAYIVSADPDFTSLGCSCPNWIYHHKDCKHIKRLLSERNPARPFASSANTPLVTSPEKLAKVMKRLTTFAMIEV